MNSSFPLPQQFIFTANLTSDRLNLYISCWLVSKNEIFKSVIWVKLQAAENVCTKNEIYGGVQLTALLNCKDLWMHQDAHLEFCCAGDICIFKKSNKKGQVSSREDFL